MLNFTLASVLVLDVQVAGPWLKFFHFLLRVGSLSCFVLFSPKQLLSLPDGPYHLLNPFLLSVRLSEVLLTTPRVHSARTELKLDLGLLPTQTFISGIVKRTC